MICQSNTPSVILHTWWTTGVVHQVTNDLVFIVNPVWWGYINRFCCWFM
jgi:hypothetical protein